MSVVVSIEGRDAIPVRAIPFVTGWKLSPDILATCLAQSSDSPSHPQNMVGHHILRGGRIAEMLPKEWDGIVSELQSLSDALHAQEVVEQASYPEWRKQSISVLPSHCFVWLDTLEAACRLAWCRLTIVNERPGDKDLNLTPYIPPELVDVVFDGLPAPSVTLQSTQLVRMRPAGIEPEPEPHQGEPAAVQSKPDIGVSRDEIAKVFPPLDGQTPEQWKNMLRDARAKWLKPARLDAGRSGIQSRWNPARLAICLAEQRRMRRSQLGALMRKHFREYLPEWEAYAGSFEN